MTTTSILNTPVLWVNAYLQEKLEGLGFDTIPFFPTTPSTINDLTEFFPAGGVMCTYDRMLRMRKSPFPHIKCEELLYYFYATAENSIINMIKITEKINRLMDGEDETAEDINAWCVAKGSITVEGETIQPNFRFHNFKVFQLQETRDIINFGTARTYAGNKIILYYDYTMIDR
jgi:predicted cupin superfamily sugar epimerase